MNSVSVTGKKWILRDFDHQHVDYLKNNFYLDEITSKLLSIRRIKNEDIKNYLDPLIKNILPNPLILKDMEKSILRTINTITKNKKIGIFGDYDVDGASSTAILGKYFKNLNINCEIYIPDRKTEGYGPNLKGFETLINKKVDLIFTVDCGTLSFLPIDFAFKKKIDVIVLDHHQSETKLPKAHAIVNPNRLDDTSNLNYLCAAGVCFLFLVALNKKLRNLDWFKKNKLTEPNLLEFLDLVSLGTVCDVVPLIGLNRAIVKQGLKILRKKSNLGLKTLINICKIETSPTTYHLGYILGPRINAGGRVGKCSHGANLLMNSNPRSAFNLASELETYNNERKVLEKSLLDNILKQKIDLDDPVIILAGDNWHEGIIGIIASRVKEKFNKPTVIISLNNKIGKASARSIYGFDIGTTIINAVQNGILLKGGGHKMAGGFTIDSKKINLFREFINKKFKDINLNLDSKRKILIDSMISPSAININFFEKIDNLSPFGSGNPEPKFYLEDLKLISSRIVGEKHIKSILAGKDGSIVKTIAFNSIDTDISAYLLNKNNKNFNIVGKLSLNEWKGEKNVEFIIDDISVNKNH